MPDLQRTMVDLVVEPATFVSVAHVQLLRDRTSKLMGFTSDRAAEAVLRSLHYVLSQIEDFLRGIEGKRPESLEAAEWLEDLEGVALRAEDVVEELNWLIKNQGSRQVRFAIPFRGLRFRKLSRKIEVILKKLGEINRGYGHLRSEFSSKPNFFDRQLNAVIETGCGLVETSVIGREKEIEDILEWLWTSDLCDSSSASSMDLSVLVLIGPGGIGKTTILRTVFNHTKVKNYFDNKIWLSVSDNFDWERIAKEILCSMGENLNHFENSKKIESMLQQNLEGNRFLFVLDDVGHPSDSSWQTLLEILVGGKEGSKILVSTRSNEECTTSLRSAKQISLRKLPFSECWSLFERYLSHICSGRLKVIGEEIVKKLNGVPLAVKAIASLLKHDLKEEAWTYILLSETWEEEINGVLPALLLSYLHLPSKLHSCFVHCALFPKGHLFERSQLINYWIGQSSIPDISNKRIEDIGNEYFDELLHRGFFQYFLDNKYVMHDLHHNLALYVSRSKSLQIIGGNKDDNTIGKNLHHLSLLNYKCSEKLVNIIRLRNLRSLLFHGYPLKDYNVLLHDLIPFLRCLRVLDLSYSPIQYLPDSISSLHCLCFLNVSYSDIIRFPKSTKKLYNLIVLEAKRCYALEKMPKGIKHLINLRHLNVDPHWISYIPGIGSLTSLQELKLFSVSKKNGFNIKELRNLNELQGELEISNIMKVNNQEEACEAVIKNKSNLTRLILKWTEDGLCDDGAGQRNWEVEEKVLEKLEPHPNLQEISIINNGGTKFTGWATCQVPLNLKSIFLSGCRNWNCFPSLQHLSSLHSLHVKSMPKLKEFSVAEKAGFSCLKILCVEDCPILENIILSQSLETLRVKKCENIKEFNMVDLHKLKEVILEDLHSLKRMSFKDCPDLTHLPDMHLLPKLKILTVSRCGSLQCLYFTKMNLVTIELEDLAGLELLTFSGSNKLEDIKLDGLKVLTNMEILSCLKLSNLVLNMVMVKILTIKNCDRLASIELKRFVCLKSLVVEKSGLTNLSLPFFKAFEDSKIEQSHKLEKIIVNFPQMHIDCCYSLKKISFENPEVSFQSIRLNNCPRLVALELHCLRLLEELIISECILLQLAELESLTRLKFLEIHRVNQRVLKLCSLTALTKLSVRDCGSLEKIDVNGLYSLESVVVYYCPKLTSLLIDELTGLKELEVDERTGLKELEVSCCASLVSIGLKGTSNLEKLVIRSCSNITSYSKEFLPSLWVTDIWMCPLLEEGDSETIEIEEDARDFARDSETITIEEDARDFASNL